MKGPVGGLSRSALSKLLLRGATGSLGVTLAGLVLAMGLQWLLTHLLGAEGYGVYTYALSIISLLVLGARMGVDTAAVRFVAQYGAEGDWRRLRGFLSWSHTRVLRASIVLGGVLALGLALGFALGFAGEGPLRSTLQLGCLLLPCLALLGLRQGVLQGLRRVVLGQMPDQLLRPLFLGALLGTFWILRGRDPGAPMVMALTLLAAAGALVGAKLLVHRSLPREVFAEAPLEEGQEWSRVSLPLLLVAGLRQVLHQGDVLLVGALLGTTQAGIYALATRFAPLVALGLGAVNSITAPLISELHAKGQRGEMQRLVSLSAWTASLSSLPLCFGLILFRNQALGFFGEEFRVGATVLTILCLAQLVNAFTGPVGWLLNMTGHQNINARILSWTTGLNLALNIPAILWLGLPGAALVTGGLQALKNLWTWFEVRKHLGINASIVPGLGSS